MSKKGNYHTMWFVLVAMAFVFAWDRLYGALAVAADIKASSRYYDLLKVMLLIGVLAALAYLAYEDYVAVKYKRLTGRRYGYDRGHYKRSFDDLVRYFRDAEIQSMDTSKLPVKSWRQSSGIIMGRVGDRLLHYEPDRDGVVVFGFGTPGVGKTTSIIATTARQYGLKHNPDGSTEQKGSCFVLDCKGDVYKHNCKHRKIKRFSLIDVKSSCTYDPLLDARQMDEDELAEYLDYFALIIIPVSEDRGESGEYFSSVARDFFTAVFLVELYIDRSNSFTDICIDIARASSYTDWIKLIDNQDYEPAAVRINKYREENPKNVGGGYSKLVKSIQLYTNRIMRHLLSGKGECISFDDLEGSTDIYIQIDPTKLSQYSSLIAMLFQSFMYAGLRRTEGKEPPICFVLDEFGGIGYVPVIAECAALFRAYNISLLICCQSLSQIDGNYGETGRKALVDCARGFCFLSINDPDTRTWASDLIGTRKALSISNSTENREKTISEVREKCVQPEEFGLLKHDDSLIVYWDGQFVRAKKNYIFK